jgi:DNA-binding response OmpR family regulator
LRLRFPQILKNGTLTVEPAKILIVDDEENNRIVLCDCLADEDYQLLEAVDGQQALDIVERERPDVILLDIMMPGLDGLAVLRKLQEQEHTRNIPVIMVTALDRDTNVSESLDAGAIDHIAKPFSVLVVLARVRSALRNRIALDSGAQSDPRGKLIGFIGSKGGVGNTTIAVNIATILASDRFVGSGASAELAPALEVALVELRPNLGTVSYQLGISTAENIQPLLDIDAPGAIDETLIRKYAITHASSGVHCLLAPPSFDPQAAISRWQAEEILETLATMADVVIVDLPSQPSEASRAALQCCDFTVLTVGLDAASLAAAGVALAGLASWGIGGDLIGAVLVARDPASESATYVQKARNDLQCPVIGVIPPAGDRCFGALKAGKPVSIHEPGSHETLSFANLAQRLVETCVPELR